MWTSQSKLICGVLTYWILFSSGGINAHIHELLFTPKQETSRFLPLQYVGMDYIYIRRNITGLKTAFEVNYWQHEWPHLSYILAHLPNVACNLVQSTFSGGYLLVWQFPQTCTILNIEMKMLILMQSGPVSFFRRYLLVHVWPSHIHHSTSV